MDSLPLTFRFNDLSETIRQAMARLPDLQPYHPDWTCLPLEVGDYHGPGRIYGGLIGPLELLVMQAGQQVRLVASVDPEQGEEFGCRIYWQLPQTIGAFDQRQRGVCPADFHADGYLPTALDNPELLLALATLDRDLSGFLLSGLRQYARQQRTLEDQLQSEVQRVGRSFIERLLYSLAGVAI